MAKKHKKPQAVNKVRHLVPRILVAPEVTVKIRQIALSSGKYETGGLLLGEKKKVAGQYAFIVKKATGPGARAEFSTHHFIPDTDFYKSELKSELHLNGLIYLGEWHKHPGAFDSPSCKDLETMKEIASNDNTKDLMAIIVTMPEMIKSSDPNQLINIDCFYYQRGMKEFKATKTEIIVQPRLKKNVKPVAKVNLDVNHVIKMAESCTDDKRVYGRLTDNKTANFLFNNIKEEIQARVVLQNEKSKEIDLNKSNEDILIVVLISPEEISATAWQLNAETGDTIEIKVNMIDIHNTLYKRLGGLDIKENIEDKKVTLLGLGSVGSAAAVQLVKAGVTNFILVDPDQLKIHNIIRHICGLNDLGRNKTDAVSERLKCINPEVNVQNIQKDFVENFDSIKKLIRGSDLFVVSTDTPDSRNLANIAAVDLKIPTIFISLHERARTGTVIRIVPGITGCRNCLGDGRWGSEMTPGTTEYSEAENERDIYFQPGLDTDISLVTNLGVKMAISTLLHPTSKISPEFNTNFIYWNGYPEDKYPMVAVAEGLGIPKNISCTICGSKKITDELLMNSVYYGFGLGHGFG